jgi:hypothetical protein
MEVLLHHYAAFVLGMVSRPTLRKIIATPPSTSSFECRTNSHNELEFAEALTSAGQVR